MHQIEMFIHAFAGLAVCRALLGSQAPGLSIDLCLYPTRPIAYTLQPTTYNLQPTTYNLHPTPHNHQPLHTIFFASPFRRLWQRVQRFSVKKHSSG